MQVSEKTRQQMAQAHMGKRHTQATKEKIRQTLLLYWREVAATNAALTAAGMPATMHRRRHSAATKEKIRQSAQGRVFSPLAKRRLQEYQEECRKNTQLKELLKQNK